MTTTVNFPGPQVLRLHYTVANQTGGTLTHTLNLNCKSEETYDPGEPWADINLIRSVGIPSAIGSVVNAIVDEIEDFFNSTDVDFVLAELFNVAAGTEDFTFVASATLALPGTAVGATNEASMTTLTFRTREGGIMRLQFMEDVNAYSQRLSYGDLNPASQSLVDYILDESSDWFWGKDTSLPIAFLGMSTGPARATFNARYR